MLAHFLLLMRDILTFASLAHAVAFDRLGKDKSRLALMFARGLVGCIDLQRIVSAAHEGPDLVITPVGDHGCGFRRFAEEVLAHIGAILRFIILVFAVDRLGHYLQERTVRIL